MSNNFFIFAIVVESSSTIIVDMQAFSMVPEINMSTAKSLSIAFELLPQFILHHPFIMLLHPTCYFLFKLHKFWSNLVASRQDFLATLLLFLFLFPSFLMFLH